MIIIINNDTFILFLISLVIIILSSVSLGSKDIRLLDPPLYESTVEKEMELLRSALNGKIEPTPEACSQFMQDFAKLRAKTEETIQWLLNAHGVLKRV